ncbi:MerR family transcriptional regulator [Microbacterium yannicii]|uniref:MerR family transcriptional regulator n=1 Tax=Microbacterium yannicii TaxID=671622 RepID=UPI00037DD941|nr:MerR family transcriptional regulator [Microbacterium yannicii]
MRTAALGRLVGYSTQQVRDLERLGVIPAAQRRANGYRRYDRRHLIALRAYRALVAALGAVPARRLMPRLIDGPIDLAAEAIDELHASLSRDRTRVREALRGLDAVLADRADVFDDRDAMSIGELAQALDVRPSALRHWEEEGLVHPERIRGTAARRYGGGAIAEARIVAALRAGGYPLPPIARILTELRAHGRTEDSRRVLETRLAELSRRSIALLEGAGDLHALLSERSAGVTP